MTGRLIIGDALAELRKLEAESVHCCVTSPPYWGLRDYGAEGQLGLEKTPEQHVGAMVAVFDEVRRVLRSDGTLWLNYGDCYNGSGPSGGPGKQYTNKGSQDTMPKKAPGLKPKDLVGMPWRVAFALQAAGWYLRSDIIWHKPNPMPESVTDRPTSAHEYLFLLAKSPRYFYDADAIREAPVYAEPNTTRGAQRKRNVGGRSDGYTTLAVPGGIGCPNAGRNKRTVWAVATQGYTGAHFATFPPKLITPCIMAGTSERGCCSGCGAAWVRVVDVKPSSRAKIGYSPSDHEITAMNRGHRKPRRSGAGSGALSNESRTTTGWRPSCGCGSPKPEPCTVLDPFGGSGTVAEVCEALGRRWVLIELNPDYEPLIRQRTAQRGLFSR